MPDKKKFRVIWTYRPNERSNLVATSYRYFDSEQQVERCILRALDDKRTFNIILGMLEVRCDIWYQQKHDYRSIGALGGFTTARSSAQAIARCLHSAAIAECYHLQPGEWS